MRTATKNLEDDHIHILRLIEVMDHIISLEKPDSGHLEKIVELIRNFADGIHHAKEEDIFFPLLEKRGFSAEMGPVAVMLQEHVTGRNYVKGISDNISRYIHGDENALGDIYRNMKGYSDLLKAHISKENNILFRMADRALSVPDNESLLVDFAKAEASHSGSKRYIDQIQNLIAYYNI